MTGAILSKLLNIFVPHCSGMLTDHQPHGDGLVAHGFIRGLAERGHSLFVAAECVALDSPLPSNVRVFPLRRRFRGVLGRLEYMLQVRKLYRKLERRVKFDLIHQLNPVYTGITLALGRVDLPVVLGPYVADWPADPDAIAGGYPFMGSILRSVKSSAAYLQQRRASALLVTTEEARRRVAGVKTSTYLLPHGIDSDFFSPLSAEERASNGSTVILFLANISERKGIFDMLKAFEKLGPRFPDVTLWIAGSGEDEGRARAIASTMPCAERIRFLGRQNRQQTAELFRSADIFCLPSHGEPFGMTVLEAMSCGVPVVATEAGGVRWIVDDLGGIRVPVKTPEELAQALADLIMAPERRRKMGVHNRQRILKEFTWERVIDRLEEIYSGVLHSHLRTETATKLAGGTVRTREEASVYE